MNNLQLGTSSVLHERVREELLKRITIGTYPPGESIPSTAALCEEFGVSPITIKRALRDLRVSGELVAVAGKGTFVKRKRRFVLALDAGISTWGEASIRLLSITREKISEPTMEIFNPPAKAMLCVRKMIFFADEVTVMYDATYLSSDVSGDIVDEFGERLIADALRRHGIDIVNTSHLVDAAPAAGQAAELFSVPNGYPMLRRFYKVETAKPSITVFGVVQSPFDRLACSINIPSGTRPKTE
ncbi:GntR family transcriptional regulator [Bradyrhizobium sp. B124]|uniref:GntR family transcriptional regulator n=1 Tax=Bradyrhizobium sp. B124 TaxID=3140245 RepID=UPI0031840076